MLTEIKPLSFLKRIYNVYNDKVEKVIESNILEISKTICEEKGIFGDLENAPTLVLNWSLQNDEYDMLAETIQRFIVKKDNIFYLASFREIEKIFLEKENQNDRIVSLLDSYFQSYSRSESLSVLICSMF